MGRFMLRVNLAGNLLTMVESTDCQELCSQRGERQNLPANAMVSVCETCKALYGVFVSMCACLCRQM